jgi:transposase
MRTEYFITMDTHCRTSDICIKTRTGKLVKRVHVSTRIPQLRAVIESVSRPRYVAFEEGVLAGWLYRELRACADDIVVCDPRRNAHVAKDGDKDDAIDAGKLNDLYRGGFLRRVHQTDHAERAATKQLIATYHDRVVHRVGEGLRLVSLCRRWGLLLGRANLDDVGGRDGLLKMLENSKVPQSIRQACGQQWDSFTKAREAELFLYEEVCKLARTDKMMVRVAELPGYGPIRAATLICYLDTPFRFKSKSALWKYVGIGLHREKSGGSLDVICVEQQCNRLLRNVTIGAAQSAIDQKENVFARRYVHWVQSGVSPKNARRNVAREQVTAIWGMWKSDKAFEPKMLSEPLQT